MKKICLIGASGKVGQAFSKVWPDDWQLIGKINSKTVDILKEIHDAELVIDFSTPKATEMILPYIKVPFICGTTGLDPKTFAKMQELDIPVFYSANMSLAVALLNHVSQLVAKIFPAEIDIRDVHHRNKMDSPSGTALSIAKSVASVTHKQVNSNLCGIRDANDIVITSQRIGGNFGEHEVTFTTDSEKLTLKHQAFNREVYAKGVIQITPWFLAQKKGMYTMQDFIKR